MYKLESGFADAIITPQLHGTYLDGYGFRQTEAVAVRDDLHAKVCALRTGEKVFLLFSIDLIGVSQRVYRLLTDQITALTGISRENMALGFIHTHAAPACGTIDELPVNYDYLAWVGEVCGRAALKAVQRLAPGSFTCEILPETVKSAANRRGKQVFDPRIRTACFRDEEGTLRGVVCTANCHAVVNMAMTVSADFLSEVNALSSDQVPYLYFQGRGADIDPVGPRDPADPLIRQLGQEVALPVQAAALRSAYAGPLQGELSVAYEWVTLPMLQLKKEDLEETVRAQQEIYFSLPMGHLDKHIALRELQWARHMLRMLEAGEPFDFAVPLQMLTLGGQLAFAFVPFEMLTVTGHALEKLFADAGYAAENTFVFSYCNCVNGYLAPAAEIDSGSYETGGAAHWYNIPQNSGQTEPAVLDWFARRLAQK